MKGMLFCAGLGTRLEPITDLVPKPLVDFFGRPIVDHALSAITAWGTKELTVNLHHLPEMLSGYLLNRWGNTFELMFSDEAKLLGTGGGLKRVERTFRDGTFFAMNGDFLLDPGVDIKYIFNYHCNVNAAASLLLHNDPGGKFTSIQLDRTGRISRLGEQYGTPDPDSPGYVFCGLQVLEPEVFDFLPTDKPCSLVSSGYIPMLRAGLPVMGYVLDGYWQEVGDFEGYLKAHFDVLDGLSPYRDVIERSGEWVLLQEDGAARDLDRLEPSLGPGVVMHPPVAISRGCAVGNGAQIGPYTVLGEGSRIGEGAVVRRSVVWRGAAVSSDAKLDGEVVCT